MKTRDALVKGDTTYDRILQDIGNGTFPGGTRLKVQALAERYGTSTNPVREALRLLQGEGIITIEPNRGATVKPFNSDVLRDIFEILQLLEPYFVSWFAETCTEDDVRALEAIQQELEKIPVEDKATFSEHDLRFHSRIASLHYNQRARGIWEVLRRSLNALALGVKISKTRHATILEDHWALIEAFRNNDKPKALAAITLHVSGAGDQMLVQLRALEARMRSASEG